MTHSETDFPPGPDDDIVPAELREAIERSLSRRPSAAMVEHLVNVATAFNAPSKHALRRVKQSRPPTNGLAASLLALVGLAACIAVMYGSPIPKPAQLAPGQTQSASVSYTTVPVYSEITTQSLAELGFQAIESDLRQAEEKITRAAEELLLAEVRRELDQALALYRWEK